MIIKKFSINKIISYIIEWLILFNYLFEFEIGMGLTTRRIAFLMTVFYLVTHKGRTKQKLRVLPKKTFLFSMLLFLFVIGIILLNSTIYKMDIENNNMYVRYIIYCILYIYIFSIYCLVRYDSIYEFAKIYLSVMIFQAICVFGSFFNRDFRVFIFSNTVTNHNDENMLAAVQNGTRITGVRLMAAGGSLVLCTGCILLLYLIINKYISNKVFLLNFATICMATMLVGRTGFYLEVLLFMAYIVLYKNSNKYISTFCLALCALGAIAYMLSTLDASTIQYYIGWIGEIFISERRYKTIGAITSSGAPDFSKELILGTNVLTGTLPTGYVMKNDSGYVRMYCAVGIVGCLCYYGAFMSSFMALANRIRDRKNRLFYLFCVLLSFVIEFKEPFFGKYFFPFMVLALGLYEIDRERKKNENMFLDRNTL